MNDTDSIFLINADNKLERVPHSQYESEDLLQTLLELHPELLVGDQINPDNPPRWILVSREAGIPDSEGGSDRWSVDHLLLDQNARPTFVEVKRSSDTRIRREVVGQMMDYAANAQAYWPQDRIRALAADNHGGLEKLDAYLADFLGLDDPTQSDTALEAYWQAVEKNLREGEVRLLFVADSIPTELRRIIEFLNEHMPRVEVLGVEVRQYAGRDVRALVPRVVGQTESARQQKSNTAPRVKNTTAPEFLAACPESTRGFFSRLIGESEQRGFIVSWRTKGFSIRITNAAGKLESLFYAYPPGLDGATEPVFQAYVGYIKDEDRHKAAMEAFKGQIPFYLRGQHTLQIELDNEGVQATTS